MKPTTAFYIDLKGNVLKQQADLGELAGASIASALEFLQSDSVNDPAKFDACILGLLAVEKKCRTHVDVKNCAMICCFILKVLVERKMFVRLCEMFKTLVRRRGQLQEVLIEMVKISCVLMENMHLEHIDYQLQFVQTISGETMGKVYVEVDRARLIRKYAQLKEMMGETAEALTAMAELQVEAYEGMDKLEKCEFALEQLRLALDQKDFIQAEVFSCKLPERLFAVNFEVNSQYHLLMAKYSFMIGKFVDVARHYKKLSDLPQVIENKQLWVETVKSMIVMLVLGKKDAAQQELIAQTKLIRNIEEVGAYQQLLSLFSEQRLINIEQLASTFGGLFEADLNGMLCPFNRETEEGMRNWQLFIKRTSEYNIHVISTHYTKIKLSTVARYLNTAVDVVEEQICEMIRDNSMYAKINRLEMTVAFVKPEDPNLMLNNWGSSLNKLCYEIDRVADLIIKEKAIYLKEN